ncbi:hypothetical protein E2C01_086745 [Portunus trituberculatus]|uniref:Uncharacterized protein n=1 Tax=Portunus trituberculatus TaxID=210409 RepID=A0A5B7J4M7_PORTR|nr:hypothetical protein [Portunus trituberculatus]
MANRQAHPIPMPYGRSIPYHRSNLSSKGKVPAVTKAERRKHVENEDHDFTHQITILLKLRIRMRYTARHPTDSYKEVAEDESTKRPGNCPALSPVQCNVQILEALKQDARKADLRMKDVNKDILKAATIIIKSLSVLDKVAQDEGHANYRNNLVRRFNIKREINQKYAHLCSDKVPMTRFLFGDDLS